jgi:ankyrin repeat protein
MTEVHDPAFELMVAADSGDATVVRRLIALSAALSDSPYRGKNKAFNKGSVPLHYAARSGHEEIVRILLAAGADPCRINSGRWTPLHFAANCGHAGVARILLDAPGGPTALAMRESYYHRTPADVASLRGFDEMVALFLSRGSPPIACKRVVALAPDAKKPDARKALTSKNTLLYKRYKLPDRASANAFLRFRNDMLPHVSLTAEDVVLGRAVNVNAFRDYDAHEAFRLGRAGDSRVFRSGAMGEVKPEYPRCYDEYVVVTRRG